MFMDVYLYIRMYLHSVCVCVCKAIRVLFCSLKIRALKGCLCSCVKFYGVDWRQSYRRISVHIRSAQSIDIYTYLLCIWSIYIWYIYIYDVDVYDVYIDGYIMSIHLSNSGSPKNKSKRNPHPRAPGKNVGNGFPSKALKRSHVCKNQEI